MDSPLEPPSGVPGNAPGCCFSLKSMIKLTAKARTHTQKANIKGGGETHVFILQSSDSIFSAPPSARAPYKRSHLILLIILLLCVVTAVLQQREVDLER